VCALDLLAPWLANYKQEMVAGDEFSVQIMKRCGIPQDVVYALRTVSAGFRGWGAAAHVTRPLAEGELLEFASRSWRVLHRPGHSPSDTVFWDEGSGELFSGDHLLAHISSNPLISKPLSGEATERPRALMDYMESLRRTREMPLSVVHPGHGEPVREHAALIDERFRMHERRAERLHGLISERPRNAYELAQEMWGNVAVTQAFLTISEVLGHVDLLIDAGRVTEREHDGVVSFEAA
jgi:glyoxylase-like metal-dependent hydrolase (beta-lactamase superfamily II)